MKILHERGSDYILYFLHIVGEIGSEQGDLSPTLYEFGLRALRHTPTFTLSGETPKPHELKLFFLFYKGTTIMAKYRQVKINFKPEDFQKLELLAEEAELTKAEYIRKNLGDFSIPKTRVPKGKIKKISNNPMLFEVAKIGANVNQIAKYCNTKKRLDTYILAELVALEKSLKALL